MAGHLICPTGNGGAGWEIGSDMLSIHGYQPPTSMVYSARRALIPALLILASVLGGCASHNGGGAGVITLHAADWGGASSDPRMNRIQHAIEAEWRRLHPNIRVEMEHIPGSSEYVSKLLTDFVAGTEPDVMSLDDASAAAFINNDTLLDLTPFIQRDHVDLSVYYPNVLDIARRGRRLYALPADFTPMMIYYNKREFDRAGVPYPRDGWTWNDFLADCKKLTVWPQGALHPTQYGFLVENWMPGWIPWIWQNGGDVLSPDGQRASGYFDAPASVDAVTFLSNLVKNNLAPTLSQNQALGADPFQAGEVAMEVSGHWNLVGLKASETISMKDVGVVGLPRNKKRISVIYESGYAITRRCKHPEAAWKYVKFMSGPFVQREKAELGIGISANRQVAEQRRRLDPLEPIFLDNGRYGRAPWGARVENYDLVEDIGAEMMDEVLVAHTPVPLALQRAAVRIDAELAS